MEEQEEYSVEEILDTSEGKKTLLYQSRKAGEAWRNFILQAAYELKIDLVVKWLARMIEKVEKKMS